MPTQQQTATACEAGRRTKPPFRADHVGSLLRPERLLRARSEFDSGRIDADGLRAVEDDAIREIVAKQEEWTRPGLDRRTRSCITMTA